MYLGRKAWNTLINIHVELCCPVKNIHMGKTQIDAYSSIEPHTLHTRVSGFVKLIFLLLNLRSNCLLPETKPHHCVWIVGQLQIISIREMLVGNDNPNFNPEN